MLLTQIKTCRGCSGVNLKQVVNLGLQPWGNDFRPVDILVEAKTYPLEMLFCSDCYLSQLSYTVPKEVMFKEHTYLSGSTNTLREHFKSNAKLALKALGKESKKVSVLDIGSNDGTQLKEFKSLGCVVKGVESADKIASIARLSSIDTDTAFFNLDYAKDSKKKYDIISASGVFFHLEELHSAVLAIKELLKSDGLFVVQFIYLKDMVKNLAFDQIYHEHLVYYLFTTLNNLVSQYDLEIKSADWQPIHGGSGIAYIGHKAFRSPDKKIMAYYERESKDGFLEAQKYEVFMEKIKIFKEKNNEYINSILNQGKRVFGMGAPVKGNTLLNYFGFTKEHIQCLVEINPLREGLKAPGSNIPIVMESELSSLPDVYYCLAWNFKKEILKRYKSSKDLGVEFYFPVSTD